MKGWAQQQKRLNETQRKSSADTVLLLIASRVFFRHTWCQTVFVFCMQLAEISAHTCVHMQVAEAIYLN